MSRQDLIQCINRCATQMALAAQLARIAAASAEPRRGASYIVDSVNDLGRDLQRLRRHLSAGLHGK